MSRTRTVSPFVYSVSVNPSRPRKERTFVAVVGSGGTGLRQQMRCTPTSSSPPHASMSTEPGCPIWASIYSTSQQATFGALFITFNVDGNTKKARGYFKAINGKTIDTFDIFAD